MSAQRGRDLLLKIEETPGTFVTIGGLRARQIALASAGVDVTHADSPGRWRELIADAGLRRASVSGAGVFRDAASDALLRNVFFAGQIRTWRLVLPGAGTLEGPFQIASLEWRGDHDAELTFDLALESASAITFTAE